MNPGLHTDLCPQLFGGCFNLETGVLLGAQSGPLSLQSPGEWGRRCAHGAQLRLWP